MLTGYLERIQLLSEKYVGSFFVSALSDSIRSHVISVQVNWRHFIDSSQASSTNILSNSIQPFTSMPKEIKSDNLNYYHTPQKKSSHIN